MMNSTTAAEVGVSLRARLRFGVGKKSTQAKGEVVVKEWWPGAARVRVTVMQGDQRRLQLNVYDITRATSNDLQWDQPSCIYTRSNPFAYLFQSEIIYFYYTLYTEALPETDKVFQVVPCTPPFTTSGSSQIHDQNDVSHIAETVTRQRMSSQKAGFATPRGLLTFTTIHGTTDCGQVKCPLSRALGLRKSNAPIRRR